MKIDKIDIKGNKQPIEVADKVFGCKINKDLISQVLYKSNANFKGRKAKTKQKHSASKTTCQCQLKYREYGDLHNFPNTHAFVTYLDQFYEDYDLKFPYFHLQFL